MATAQVFAGRVDDAQRSVLERLCASADSALADRLREGLTPADCYDSFVCAAAWLALSQFETTRDSGVEAFTAGTFSVRRGGEAAKRLEVRAETLMRPYLRDGRFEFRRV